MAPPMDLKDLRNMTKRDPSGYHAEFLLQYRHFQTQLQIFLLNPSEDYKPFNELVEYLCHVSDIYTKDMPDFPQQISNLLEKNCDILASPLRRALVSALILLRSKNQITSFSVLQLFFKLFRCKDAGLREMLYKHIVSDITNINKKHKNQQLNSALQNFMFEMMKDPNEMAAKQSLNVMIELYRKKIWNDPKTVNVISTGVFSGITNVVVASLKFFLTVAADDEEDRIAEHKEKAKLVIKKTNLKLGVRKLGKGARDKLEKTLHAAHNDTVPQRKLDPNWPAIELINDPQGYTEKVFGVARHSFERIEVRLMLMNFISRLIFTHKLIVLQFYPFVQRYLMPKNEHVTYALSILAQCVHELIPPSDLQPVVKHLVDKFVHDRSSTESVVCGLHTLREMCNRNHLIMTEPLLREMSQYKNHKDKAVTTAARGLIHVFRVHNPALLERKDRGKEGAENMKEKPLEYGQVRTASGVADIELLQRIKMIEQEEKNTKSKKVAAEVDLEGNVIAYESDEEEEGEDGWMEVSDEEGEDGEADGLEDGDEDGEMEDDEDEDEEESEEEIQVPLKKMKKSALLTGGVIPTSGVMSIADALKLEQMQRDAIEAQHAKLLRSKDKRKRSEEEDDEDEESEDEDEEDEDEEELVVVEKAAPAPAAPVMDIWDQIESGTPVTSAAPAAPAAQPIQSPKPVQSAKPVAKKEEPVTQRKNAPPTKRAKVEVVPDSDEEEEEDDLSEIDSDEWEIVEDGDAMSEDDEEEEEIEEVKPVSQKKNAKPEKANGHAANGHAANGHAANGVAKKQNGKQAQKKEEKVEEEKVDLGKPIDQAMILTEEDFAKLARLKEMKAEGKISLARLRNLTRDMEEDNEVESSSDEETGVVDPASLTRGIKALRKTQEERQLEKLDKQASRPKRMKEKKSRLTTNEEKTKLKAQMMIVKGKKYTNAKESFRDKQMKKQKGKQKQKRYRHKM